MTQLWYPEKCPSKSAAVLHRTCELGSLLQTLSQPRKGNPNPNKGTTEREDCDLCNHWSNSSARQLWSCAIIHYRYRKRFLTKIRQTITVPEGTSIIFRHRSSLALSLSLSNNTITSTALLAWKVVMLHLIQTLLLPCCQHRQLLTNNDSADKLESELCL